MNGLFKDTLAELFDKKTVYLFFVITIIATLITIYSGIPILMCVKALMSLLTFLVIILTAGILPNMFIKGRADYFLSKPLSRSSLLLKKFLSVWVIYGVLVTACGFVCYLSGALIHSLFNYNIFLLMGLVFVELFIWLSISFFIGIFTGKTVSVIMFLFITWVTQTGLSLLYSSQMIAGFGYKMVGKAFDYLYFVFPKISELSTLVEKVVAQSASLNSYILYSSVGFGFAMLYFTLMLFKRKNY